MVGIAEAEKAKIVRNPGILIFVFWGIFLHNGARDGQTNKSVDLKSADFRIVCTKPKIAILYYVNL